MVISTSRSGSVYAGTGLALSAGISFNDLSAVDVDLSLDISWSRDSDVIPNDSDVIANDTRTTVSAVSGSGDNYTASLIYTPVATSDSGQVTATVTVSPSDDSMYIQNVTANDTEMLAVEGTCTLYVIST